MYGWILENRLFEGWMNDELMVGEEGREGVNNRKERSEWMNKLIIPNHKNEVRK